MAERWMLDVTRGANRYHEIGSTSRKRLFSGDHCLFRSLFRPCRASPWPAHRVRHPVLFPSFRTHSTPSFLPAFRLFSSLSLSRVRTHTRGRIYIYIYILSLSFSLSHSHSRCVEKRSMRTPRYYVMPADRGLTYFVC